MFSAEKSSSEDKIFGGINSLGETPSVRLHQMKPIRIPKYGKWLLIALAVFAAGIFGIAWIPAPIEGTYGYTTTCLCGGKGLMHFEGGKVIMYNTKHPPGTLYADYVLQSDGSVKIIPLPEFGIEGQTEEERNLTVIPRLFFLEVPKQPATPPGGFDIRVPLVGNVKSTIATHDISRTFERENGVFVKETYDRDLKFVRSEVLKKRGEAKEKQ